MFLALQTWLRVTSDLGVQNNKLKKTQNQKPNNTLVSRYPENKTQKPQSSDYSDALE